MTMEVETKESTADEPISEAGESAKKVEKIDAVFVDVEVEVEIEPMTKQLRALEVLDRSTDL